MSIDKLLALKTTFIEKTTSIEKLFSLENYFRSKIASHT